MDISTQYFCIFAYMYQNTTSSNTYFTCYSHVYARNWFASQKPYIGQICSLVYVQIWDYNVNIYVSYELTAVNSIRSTTLHIFKINGIYPWINMSATLHVYVPLHYCCRLHINPTLCISSQKTTNWNFYLPCYCHKCANKIMPLKCHM